MARSIIEHLFPPAAVALTEPALIESEVGTRSTFTQEWLRDLRVCHPDVFERYFRFSLSDEDLSEAELASILAVAGDRARLVGKLKELNDKRLLRATLDRFRADGASIVPFQNAVTFITGLFDFERELCAQTPSRGRAEVLPEQRAIFIIHSILRPAPLDQRGSALRESVAQTTGVYLPMMSFKWSREGQESDSDSLISDKDSEELRDLCINKIKAAAQTPELLSHPRLRYILRIWSQWGSVEDAPTWVRSKISASDSDLLALLKAFTERMTEIEGERTIRVLFRFGLGDFARYVEPQDVVNRVRQLASSAPDKEDRIWCRLFLQAFQNWKVGDKSADVENADPTDLSQWTAIESLGE